MFIDAMSKPALLS